MADEDLGRAQGDINMEDPSDLDHSDSEESGTSEEEVEESGEISMLRHQLKLNPFFYNGHLKLVGLLRDNGDLERLREAREKMSDLFPLTEELWLQWINDESPLAVIPERREYIVSLFEKAVKDYISVKIWSEYCQFVMDRISSSEEIETVRALFERAIVAAGLHLIEGSALWEGYREFEMSILQSYQGLEAVEDAVGNADLKSKIEVQMGVVISIFKRQLSVPLLGMQQTMRVFEDWSIESVSETIEANYQKALKKMEDCLQYEEALKGAIPPKLAEYESYISYEMKDGNPARIQCIFERAIRDNCLDGDLWGQYTNYMDHKLKVSSAAIPVYKRALRNCPWVSKLWMNYMRALERLTSERGKVKATFDQALQCDFALADDYAQLWLAYLEYLWRTCDRVADSKECEHLRKAFENATKFMNEGFSEDSDKAGLITRLWAYVEVKCFDNLQRAQELWDGLMKRHSREAHMWLEYTNFLRMHGNADLARKAYQRAVQTNMDSPETICNAFLRFEREEGNISQFESALQRVEESLRRHARKKQQEEAKEAALHQRHVEAAESRKEDRKKRKQEKKADKKKQDFAGKESETSHEEKVAGHKDLVAMEEPPLKRRKEEEKIVAEEQREADDEGKNLRPKEDKNTVFLSNLLFTVDENHIREKFECCGEIAEVRLVKNRAGKSKGYAYLEFKDEQSSHKALEMDRASLLSRPVFVSPMTDKSKHPTQFKFATTLDKTTIFVANLPFTASENDVHNIFKECGKIKQVRLVTNRSGKSKGYGYVEFEEENAASQAVLKLDDTEFGERKMRVALSNPPSRNVKKEEQAKEQERPAIGSRGKARTQLAMMPRALSKPKEVSKAVPTTKEENAEEKTTTKKMSNDDFRKLLGSK